MAYQYLMQPHDYATIHHPNDFANQVNQQNLRPPPPQQPPHQTPQPQFNTCLNMHPPQQSGFSSYGQRGRANRGRYPRGGGSRGGGRGNRCGRGNQNGY